MVLQRKQLGELLEDLLDGLLGAGLIRGRAQIIEARVPIIKCCLAVGEREEGGRLPAGQLVRLA